MLVAEKISAMVLVSVAAAGSYALIRGLLASPLVQFFVDKPSERKVHQNRTPRLGGLAMVVLFIALLLCWHLSPLYSLPRLPLSLFWAMIAFSVGILGIGIIDDSCFITIPNGIKLLLELALATSIVIFSGMSVHTLQVLQFSIPLGFLAIPLTVLWMAGVTNAVNLIDGVDGLAGSVSFIGFAGLALIALIVGRLDLMMVCLLCAGLIVGFLLHNWSPASLFMGDTGSLFLGMMLGLMSVALLAQPQVPVATQVAFLVVGFPLLDVSLAMVRRFSRALLAGERLKRCVAAMFKADNEHIHHRFIHRGLTHAQTVLVISILAATMNAIAIVSALTNEISAIGLMLYFALVLLWLVHRLDYLYRVKSWLKRSIIKGASASGRSRAVNIAIISTDALLRHSMISYKQNLLRFRFYDNQPSREELLSCAAVVIDTEDCATAQADMAMGLQILALHRCPLVCIADTFSEQILKHPLFARETVIRITKPLYIPRFLNQLYQLVSTAPPTRYFVNPQADAPLAMATEASS
jgi:UDP-GlcNAc:undecaprenyl-phosphate GlcNAc-1-phosphate transferase